MSKLTKKAILEALRSLPSDEWGPDVTVQVGEFTLWRCRNYPTPGFSRRFAWRWEYYGSHPGERYHFGGTASMHTMADIVVRVHSRQSNQEGA